MINAKTLSYSYAHEHRVFEKLDFNINEGEFWGILGRNGAGKTTLLDLIMGIKLPSDGEISVIGENARLVAQTKNEIAYLSQDIKIKGNIKIKEFLKFHAHFHENYSVEMEKELLEYFKMNPDAQVGSLSTGQQKKVQIIAGLAANTKIIIIDEITAVLDPESRKLFFDKLTEYNQKHKKTILLATNIAEDLENNASHILFINEHRGEVVGPNDISQLFEVSHE